MASEASSKPGANRYTGVPAFLSTPEVRRFQLIGSSRVYDPRIHAVRRDIADIDLAGWLFAPHYASAEIRSVAAGSTMICDAPDSQAVSQLLYGEDFAVLDESRGWAWGYSTHDHYVGYVRADALGNRHEPTHLVSVREAPVFSAPDIKAPVLATLSLGARFVGASESNFVSLNEGYLHRRHCTTLDGLRDDPVAVAEKLLGAPYLWGGRGAGGIDCSGLVQLALELQGVPCPRDSDQQMAVLGNEIDGDVPLKRGDLLFFPGHVGLMYDEGRLLHANAFHMAVTIEPLGDIVDRLLPDHPEPVLARRRL